MSIQFGKCNFDGHSIDPKDLDQVRPILAPYGPDREGYICEANLGVLYRALHTTKESQREIQPFVSPSGAVITWDGRLDNREQLMGELKIRVSEVPTDLAIVATAYEHWGTASFPKLIGDWALSVWNPKEQAVTLAKDFAGTRHLYYSVENNEVTWCTILDPLIMFSARSFRLEEEYLAGWLSFFPAPHLTPYVGIHAVPPSSFVRISRARHNVTQYWCFNPAHRIRYRNDEEYEQEFRRAFAESIRRRLRSNGPLFAELSGGMDSSSIVCVADDIISRAGRDVSKLHTVSYYDDTEPNWDERPYFIKVEERRGQAGFHIDASRCKSLILNFDPLRFPPGPFSSGPSELSKKFEQCLTTIHSRVVISGFGGDEVMGGVPTPVPELADLIANGEFKNLTRQLKNWALQKRKPWLRLFMETVEAFAAPGLLPIREERRPAPWLAPGFAKQHRAALSGYPRRFTLTGPPPSFQENLIALAALRRQLGCSSAASSLPYEKRYPFLDRDLLEFIYAVPREQLVRPGQRRSLMRRSLEGILPPEILNRKRKAYITRAPMAEISENRERLARVGEGMLSTRLGIIDSRRFREALESACRNQPVAIVTLRRTLALELWLEQLVKRGLLIGRCSGDGGYGSGKPLGSLASQQSAS